jgi:phospholipid/cholesterol/gamma-HCH transport system substrate-binding protein
LSRRAQRLARSQRTDPIAGIVALLLGIVFVWWAYVRPDPLRDPQELQAVVTSVNGLRPGFSPVRVAGVDVGEVSAVESFRGTRTSLVTMELEDTAPALHADARVKVRPRLFLEGNSFVELEPGRPAAPLAREGMRIPLERTSVAVSMPHVLGALQADTRRSLQEALVGYGEGLNDAPQPLEELPLLTGGQGLNEALRHAARALPTSALLSDASTGRRPGDLNRAIDRFGEVAEALNDSGPALPALLSSLRRSSAAFARESESVTLGLRRLPGALSESEAALRELRVAMPPARELAAATREALPALPGALAAGVPWLVELNGLLGPAELGADLDSLLPATRQLAPAVGPTAGLLHELDLLSRCSAQVLIPTANARIEDGPRTAGSSVFAEFLSAAVGANGAAQTYDGNGYLLRGNPGGGEASIATGKTRWMGEPVYGNALAPSQGTHPAAPRTLPSGRADVSCHANPAPDLNGPAAAPGPPDGSGR